MHKHKFIGTKPSTFLDNLWLPTKAMVNPLPSPSSTLCNRHAAMILNADESIAEGVLRPSYALYKAVAELMQIL